MAKNYDEFISLEDLEKYEDYTISVLSDLHFADTKLFPQEVQDKLLKIADLLQDYYIFLEYYPHAGLVEGHVYKPQDMPDEVREVFDLCIEQIDRNSSYNQESEGYIIEI